jgi:hypothetical protein
MRVAMTVEVRAARLVRNLENAGKSVASVTVRGDEITVIFAEGQPAAVNPIDLIDFGSPVNKRRQKAGERQKAATPKPK